jgi:hypothetical protein
MATGLLRQGGARFGRVIIPSLSVFATRTEDDPSANCSPDDSSATSPSEPGRTDLSARRYAVFLRRAAISFRASVLDSMAAASIAAPALAAVTLDPAASSGLSIPSARGAIGDSSNINRLEISVENVPIY